jgi:hypothetical protein
VRDAAFYLRGTQQAEAPEGEKRIAPGSLIRLPRQFPRLNPHDLPQLLIERRFVIIAFEFDRGFAEPLDLGPGVRDRGVCGLAF